MIDNTGIPRSSPKSDYKLPVLIVCYLRPASLETLLTNDELVGRSVYIFIDRCTTDLSNVNNEVYETATRYSNKLNLTIFWTDSNLGVERGVPTAIEWISIFESKFIILEDDCMPRPGAFDWFDTQISNLNQTVVAISGFSPAELSSEGSQVIGYECRYPMIWGWATSKEAWHKVKPQTYSLRTLTHEFIKSERGFWNRISFAFFFAAQLRFQGGSLKAWDAPLVLNMLINRYKAIIPSRCLIDNIGSDSVASHVQIKCSPGNSVLNRVEIRSAGRMEKEIQTKIFQMKKRHILSPLKALIFP